MNNIDEVGQPTPKVKVNWNYTAISIPKEFVPEIDAIADSLDRPRSWVVRKILREYLAKRKGGKQGEGEKVAA